MATSPLKKKTQEILALADVTINGSNSWDIQVHNDDFYDRVLSHGSLGLGESYMDGWWDAPALDQFFDKILSVPNIERKVSIDLETILLMPQAYLLNMQTKTRSKKVARDHYDIGNDFYEKMLDPYMQYTCGYWKDARNLNKAQEDKLDMICKKAMLKKGETVLELGCGWGGFSRFAAQHYNVHVTGYNISKEQIAYAREKAKGLPIEYKEADYRDATGTFDTVVAIGMAEHVGYRNYRSFMELADARLKEGGIFFLHTIGGNRSVKRTDPWIEKYVFPNSMLPSMAQLSKAAEKLFVMEDWHNLSTNYDKTLMAWWENFNHNWPTIKSNHFNDRFYRMWKYYLLCCAGGFRARRNQLWQVVYSKGGIRGGYKSIR
ncbi:MAG: cyclopropane fatty acyl phospholipid synthase [bacterium]|nr:cyclopropane fatty acyl phospholipid synthase [bacterium]